VAWASRTYLRTAETKPANLGERRREIARTITLAV